MAITNWCLLCDAVDATDDGDGDAVDDDAVSTSTAAVDGVVHTIEEE